MYVFSDCRSSLSAVNGRRLLSALAQTDDEKQLITKPRVENSNPLIHADYFNVQSMFTIRDLLEARVHLGHTEGSLNDCMKPYIYGSRLGHTIFDLDQTATHLRRALNVTAHVALQGGIILMFGRSSINAHLIEKTALECGEYAHTKYWRGGTLTNSKVQFKAVTSKLFHIYFKIQLIFKIFSQDFPILRFSSIRKATF